jgi:starvation-inducible DNA-binding protein
MSKKKSHDPVIVGMEKKGRTKVAEGLSRFLSDSYLLYLKTQNFHWNVEGKEFASLHLLFEDQYKDLSTAVDTIAERIRALGMPAPGSFKEFSALSSIKEATDLPASDEMIRLLMQDNETASNIARELEEEADKYDDEVTKDMLITRMQKHDKNAWMLRSLLS